MRFLLTLAVLLCAALPVAAEERIHSDKADFKVVEVLTDLSFPWSIAFLPQGGYLITERDGRLLRIGEDGTRTEITGFPNVHSRGQGGLFDVILGPDFKADKGWIYWAYTGGSADENNTEVARGMFDTKTNKLTDIKIIFRAEPKVRGSNHYGGKLTFGTDGALYVSLGDRYDHRDQAQKLDSHMGKIVRINPDGTLPNAGNPFRHRLAALADIYTYGHRNVQGMAVQPATGKMWIHEHGPKGGDEVNILKAGANYGWPVVTYGVDYSGRKISDRTEAPGITPPVVQWTPSIAPSGMAFYRGQAFPGWRNSLFVGALAGQQLRRLEVNGERVEAQEILLADMNERIRDVRVGPDGLIYLLTDSHEGRLLRLEPFESPVRK